MFLRATTRKKDGQEHRYFSIVENKRVSGGRVLQRHVLYLGEINSSQELAWRRSIEVLDEGTRAVRTLALFAEDGCEAVVADASIVRLKLAQLRLERPRQWGACWLAVRLWQQLKLDEFWRERLPPSRKGTRFDQVLLVLVVYRLLSPGSEWRLHVQYLVGTPKGRLTRLQQALLEEPWHAARPGVQVKLLAQDDELYVFAESRDRVAKERSMRRRQLKWLWARLNKLSTMSLTRDALLMKLGAAQTKTPAAWRLIEIAVAKDGASFTYGLDRDKLRQVRRREGRYLLRTNLTESDPAKLWQFYLQLVEVEAAFKTLKGDLAIRPVFHQEERRIEAHIFIAFLAYGRELSLTRYTQPEPELKLLLEKLKLTLPAQAPPKIAAHAAM